MAKRRIKKPEGQAEQWHTPKKRMKGEGVFYDEPKSETVKIELGVIRCRRSNLGLSAQFVCLSPHSLVISSSGGKPNPCIRKP